MAERTTVTVFKVGTTAENAASWVPYLDDVSLNRIRNEIDAKTLASPQAVLMSDESADIPIGGPYTNASDNILLSLIHICRCRRSAVCTYRGPTEH